LQITESLQTKDNIYSLGWLRGIASLLVCVYHLKLYIWKDEIPNKLIALFSTGNFGVTMFFIISGFVIPYSMYVKKYSLSRFWKFLSKRTVRIEPPYILYILIFFAWDSYAQTQVWGHDYPQFQFKQFFLNITYLAPFFNVEWFNIIFWTLAIEFQFYILTGLVYDLLMKNPVYKFSLFAVILAIGFVIPERLQTIFHYYIYFIVGFQSFLYFTKNIKIREFLITVIISLLYIFFLKEKMAAYYAIFTVAGIFLLNYNLKWPQFFGNISYSLYLTHGMIGGTVIMFTDHGLPKAFLFSVALFNSIIIAWFYYSIIEKPFLTLSKKIRY
jgi:peptidoglycan/LPS O-acetylase OafA/YrhL